MRRKFALVIATVYTVVLFPWQMATYAQEPQNIWRGSLSTAELSEVEAKRTADSPFCDYGYAAQKRLLDPLGDAPLASLFESTDLISLGEKCLFRNTEGIFTEHLGQLLYSKSMEGSFHSLYPRTATGIFEYIPSPGGKYILSQYRQTPFHKSARLGYHPTFRDDTSLQWYRGEYYMKHVSSGFSLTFAGGEGYDISEDALAFSQNGKFAVVSRGPVIEKINLEELSLTPIAYVSTPNSTRLAISNDGRYVAYGKNTYLNVADTDGCELVFERGSWVKTLQLQYAGCDISGDVTDSLYDQGLLSRAIGYDFSRPYFSINGSSITVLAGHTPAGQDPMWQEYRIEADDYVNEASGYLALGDSYVSGEGDLQGGEWYEPGTDLQGDKQTFAGRNLCHLSRRSYPYLMAVELGYLSSNTATPPADGLFHSVACSGAKIHNIIGGRYGLVEEDAGEDVFRRSDNQYRRIDNGSELGLYQPGYRSQVTFFQKERIGDLNRKELTPEVISLSIGGNDVDFGGFIASCTTPGTCDLAQPGSVAAGSLGMRIAEQKNRLTKAFQQAKKQSPDSRIYVHGYPRFINDAEDIATVTTGTTNIVSNACGFNVRLDLAERQAAVQGINYMNAVIEAAAKEAGVFYIDVSNALVDGRLCDRTGLRGENLYVNGVTAGNDIINFCPWRSGCIGNESFHPNQEGHKKYLEAILTQTSNLTAPIPEPVSTDIPAPPDFFGVNAADYVSTENILRYSSTVTIPQPATFISIEDTAARGIDISYGRLLPGSTLKVEIQSTPTNLGEFTVPVSGELDLSLLIPESVEYGSHTIYLKGLDDNGDQFIVYEPIYVAFSETDADGDGVSNVQDSCRIIPNSSIDLDEDGIDDACDSDVAAAELPQPPKPEHRICRVLRRLEARMPGFIKPFIFKLYSRFACNPR